MSALADPVSTFQALHVPGRPLLLPNPWDVGTARLLESLGFAALATTSSGHAASLGRPDGSVDRSEAIEHAAEIADAVSIPVSADLENGYGDDPAAVHATVTAAVHVGLAGSSIEDYSRDEQRVYPLALATERVAAAVEAARRGPGLVLTARAENHIRGIDDLDDTITRLLSFQQAGADVLYAPGLTRAEDIARVVAALDRPLNVLAIQGAPSVTELARIGVARVSVGGAFHEVASAAMTRAACEFRDRGTYGFTA